MFSSYLLSLREGLEAALIIGIVLGVLTKMNRPQLKPAIWAGVFGAVLLSLGAALLLHYTGAHLEHRAEEIFEGITMLVAASVLTWMIFWMCRRAGTLKYELEEKVQRTSLRGGAQALFLLAFLAVGREGLELALFLVAAGLKVNAPQIISGAALGLGTAVLLGWILFTTTRRLPINTFFQVTNILLLLFAAGLVAHGVHELSEAGLIPPFIEHVWDTNRILDENSTTGELLKAVFGYNGNPSLIEVIAYLCYFVVMGLGIKFFTGQAKIANSMS